MNRIDRLTAILIQLQSKNVVTAGEIADRFQISLRTVYRDIRALEAAGVPIGAEAGLGYFIPEGYNLPPVKFSKEEAGALLMAAKLGEKQTDRSVEANLRNALYKIRAALRIEEKEYLETIEKNIEVVQLPTSVSTDEFPDHFLVDIQKALAARKVINFDYYSPQSDSFSNRDVEPLYLSFYSRHWHLIGYCRLRKAFRDFRSDRIMKLNTTQQVYDHRKYQKIKSYSDLINQGQDLQEVILLVSKKVASYISEQKFFMGYVESRPAGDTERMIFMSGDLQSFAHWLLQFVDETDVVAPKKLKQIMRDLVSRSFAHYFPNKKI